MEKHVGSKEGCGCSAKDLKWFECLRSLGVGAAGEACVPEHGDAALLLR